MARIYPQWISDDERDANPGRRAEYWTYDLLNEQLGTQWLVLYGSAIKWSHKYGVSDREVEFIIAHPELGILALEVKGGDITRNGNQWYTTTLSQHYKPVNSRAREPIKNPYTQVTDAAKAYERKIQEYLNLQRQPPWQFTIGTAVFFPDVEISQEYLGADALPELTLDRKDLYALQQRLFEIMKLYGLKLGTPPGEHGIDILTQVLARDWHLESFLAYQIEEAERRRDVLTQEQFDFLYGIEGISQILISGCAGSGKTTLAVMKANLLARQFQRVLLTCFNDNLAQTIQASPNLPANVHVAHFHGLCSELVRASKNVDLPPWSEGSGVDNEEYFEKTMPEALALAAVDLGMKFDAIIVDEGQDFKTAWFNTLHDFLLTDAEPRIFYVFYDDNQRLYSREKIPFSWPPYKLTRNMRNTDPIFEQVKKYYHLPERIRSSGIAGPEPWFVPCHNELDLYDTVQDVLEQLAQEKIPLSRVTILTPRSKDNSIWNKKSSQPGKYAPVWRLDAVANQVSVSSIPEFKGLENSVIILTELEHAYTKKAQELMYVATSRARDHLIVVGNLPNKS